LHFDRQYQSNRLATACLYLGAASLAVESDRQVAGDAKQQWFQRACFLSHFADRAVQEVAAYHFCISTSNAFGRSTWQVRAERRLEERARFSTDKSFSAAAITILARSALRRKCIQQADDHLRTARGLLRHCVNPTTILMHAYYEADFAYTIGDFATAEATAQAVFDLTTSQKGRDPIMEVSALQLLSRTAAARDSRNSAREYGTAAAGVADEFGLVAKRKLCTALLEQIG
jgi:hypothetical protein